MSKASNLNQLKNERSKRDVWGYLNKSKIKIIRQFSGKKILDVGCSKGETIFYLNNHGYDAYGCDLIQDAAWKGLYIEKFRQADIYKLPYKNKEFDTVICFEVFEHLEFPNKALKELFRVASNNVIISVPNCENVKALFLSGLTYSHNEDRTHINFYTEDLWKKFIVKNRYTIKYMKKIDSIMPESILLYTWHLPMSISIFVGKIFQRIPLKKKIYTDIVSVITK